ncbi:MAG: 23S rRNA (pseudouridine(1915)-N(3))-methyltransferase RlmH [Alphaproteobacteria bacterium]|nr:23S rRNA (pseudouridine(1915)-N(3))-methyltransferase RlmH [Alphaproteobacteria bacterium]
MKTGAERDLFDVYAGRLNPAPELREVEEKRRLEGPRLKAREAELLLGATPDGAMVVALDERGRQMSSRAFADRLGAWRDEGVRDVAFLIGGADGLDESVRAKADLILSLGEMTWPHMLVRGMLAEQIYRAHAILSGHPYHRD